MSLVDFPEEMIQFITSHLDVFDSVSFKATCKHCYAFVNLDIIFPDLLITKLSKCYGTDVMDKCIAEFIPRLFINLKRFYTVYDELKRAVTVEEDGGIVREIYVVLPEVGMSYPRDKIDILYNVDYFAMYNKYSFTVSDGRTVNYMDNSVIREVDYVTPYSASPKFLREIIRRCLKITNNILGDVVEM